MLKSIVRPVDHEVCLPRVVASGFERRGYSQLENARKVLLGQCGLPWQQEESYHLDSGAAARRWLSIPTKRARMPENA